MFKSLNFFFRSLTDFHRNHIQSLPFFVQAFFRQAFAKEFGHTVAA